MRDGRTFVVCDHDECGAEHEVGSAVEDAGRQAVGWYTFIQDGTRRQYCPDCGSRLVRELTGPDDDHKRNQYAEE